MKRMVSSIQDPQLMTVDAFDPDREVAIFKSCNSFYKLQRVTHGSRSATKYAWVTLHQTECFANGIFSSYEDAIERSLDQGFKILVFSKQEMVDNFNNLLNAGSF